MRVVVIGAGHAGIEVVDALRREGFDGAVTLIDEQSETPYQRPPLSKELLQGAQHDPLPLRHESFFEANNVRFLPATKVDGIDRGAQVISLAGGTSIGYDRLVIATGCAPRRIDGFDPSVRGVHELRTLENAQNLLPALRPTTMVAIIGAGFIGLEVAAAAKKTCRSVVVLEAASRPLERAVSEPMSSELVQRHRAAGIDIRLSVVISKPETDRRSLRELIVNGDRMPVDAVVVGVGVVPRTELAEAAELAVDNGIVVDSSLRTSDPLIFAVGDCARFPLASTGKLVRLESVPNGTDMARHAARVIMGSGTGPYVAAPWFWSVQGAMRLQIAGLSSPSDDAVVFPSEKDGSLTVARFDGGVLTSVETLNDPGIHLAARKVLAGGGASLTDVVRSNGDFRRLANRASEAA